MTPNRLLPTALLAVVVPLAGCAAGQNDTTSHERPTPYTADANIGSVFVRNVVIMPTGTAGGLSASPSPTDTTSPEATAAAGPQAYLALTLASSSTDRLTGVSITGATVTPSAGADFTVKPQQLLMVEDPDSMANASGPTIEITGLPSAPVVGTTMAVTLTFEKAGQVTVQAPVRDVAAA